MATTIEFTPAENALIDECYTVILDLIKNADKIVVTGFSEVSKKIDTKTASWDLVTKYDRQVEELLIDGILAKYPDHKYVHMRIIWIIFVVYI